jgi:hypothetical protein
MGKGSMERAMEIELAAFIPGNSGPKIAGSI